MNYKTTKKLDKIGKIIFRKRKEKNITQEKLASLSGLDRSHIGFIEQGRRNPTITTLYKICDALDLRLEDLVKEI